MPIREERPDATVADTVDTVTTDQTEVPMGMEVDPVVAVEVEDPVVAAVEVEHPVDQAAMVAAEAAAVADSHSHLPTSIRCPLQRPRSSASNLT